MNTEEWRLKNFEGSRENRKDTGGRGKGKNKDLEMKCTWNVLRTLGGIRHLLDTSRGFGEQEIHLDTR